MVKGYSQSSLYKDSYIYFFSNIDWYFSKKLERLPWRNALRGELLYAAMRMVAGSRPAFVIRDGYRGWRRIAIQYDTARAYRNTYRNILGILCMVI